MASQNDESEGKLHCHVFPCFLIEETICAFHDIHIPIRCTVHVVTVRNA